MLKDIGLFRNRDDAKLRTNFDWKTAIIRRAFLLCV